MGVSTPTSAPAADCPGADLVPSLSNTVAIGQATLCLLNAERVAQGLAPLTDNPQLDTAALAYSQRMVAESFFAHEAPDGSTLVDRLKGSGYLVADDGWVVGENLAWGQGPLSTPRAIMTAWMNSEGHRANILNEEYGEIGFGLAMGTPPDRTWGATFTTEFGTRRALAPVPRPPASSVESETSAARQQAAAVAAARAHRLLVARVKAKAQAKAKAKARAKAKVRAARRAKIRAARERAARARAAERSRANS